MTFLLSLGICGYHNYFRGYGSKLNHVFYLLCSKMLGHKQQIDSGGFSYKDYLLLG